MDEGADRTGTAVADGWPAADGKPLEPITTIVGLLLALLVALTVITLAFSAFGGRRATGTIYGIGRGAVPTIDVPVREFRSTDEIHGWHPQAGVDIVPRTYRVRISHPDFAQRFWYTVAGMPGMVVTVGGLWLAYRLLKKAHRDGIYTVATARRLGHLGEFLIVGSLAGMAVTALADGRLLATMVTNHVDWLARDYWDVPWALVIFGAALLSLGRIMRIGARMHAELAETV